MPRQGPNSLDGPDLALSATSGSQGQVYPGGGRQAGRAGSPGVGVRAALCGTSRKTRTAPGGGRGPGDAARSGTLAGPGGTGRGGLLICPAPAAACRAHRPCPWPGALLSFPGVTSVDPRRQVLSVCRVLGPMCDPRTDPGPRPPLGRQTRPQSVGQAALERATWPTPQKVPWGRGIPCPPPPPLRSQNGPEKTTKKANKTESSFFGKLENAGQHKEIKNICSFLAPRNPLSRLTRELPVKV